MYSYLFIEHNDSLMWVETIVFCVRSWSMVPPCSAPYEAEILGPLLGADRVFNPLRSAGLASLEGREIRNVPHVCRRERRPWLARLT